MRMRPPASSAGTEVGWVRCRAGRPSVWSLEALVVGIAEQAMASVGVGGNPGRPWGVSPVAPVAQPGTLISGLLGRWVQDVPMGAAGARLPWPTKVGSRRRRRRVACYRSGGRDSGPEGGRVAVVSFFCCGGAAAAVAHGAVGPRPWAGCYALSLRRYTDQADRGARRAAIVSGSAGAVRTVDTAR